MSPLRETVISRPKRMEQERQAEEKRAKRMAEVEEERKRDKEVKVARERKKKEKKVRDQDKQEEARWKELFREEAERGPAIPYADC
jgi:hypothetical protein